jgi:hypothetical protein
MPVLGIEFNDAAITGVGEAGVVFSEPGYAFVDGAQNLFGVEARPRIIDRQHQFSNLRPTLQLHPTAAASVAQGIVQQVGHQTFQQGQRAR